MIFLGVLPLLLDDLLDSDEVLSMTIDPGLHRIVAQQPYPLMFATSSGVHPTGSPSPDSDSTGIAFVTAVPRAGRPSFGTGWKQSSHRMTFC